MRRAARRRERIAPPDAARACTDLAIDALHSALAAAVAEAHPVAVPGRIVVAMSGGVDSAVALTKAIAAGLSPVGITCGSGSIPRRLTASGHAAPEAVRSARDTCHRLGVPHLAIDLRDEFRHAVVDDFVSAHAAGRTLNPCMRCNGAFRFSAIAAVADRVGGARIATGHYARIERRDGRALVARGPTRRRTSYMLASVPSEILKRCWFPLGSQTKVETRSEARAAGLAAAEAAESQEVCFVGGGDHRSSSSASAEPASRRDRRLHGAGVRTHGGLHRFTPGQRSGLGLGGGEPRTSFAPSPRPAASSWGAARSWLAPRCG